MVKPVEIQDVRNIAISGRIGTGATTLATKLSARLGWEMLDGGKILRKANRDVGASVIETNKRPDKFDLDYEEMVKKILTEEKNHIIQSHLAGFDAQGIPNVFKIVVLCEDSEGNDKTEIRIDRLVNRDGVSIDYAKHEIVERERQNLEKWRRLYANGDPNWVYWDKKYYDLVVNTFSHNQEEAFQYVLSALKIS